MATTQAPPRPTRPRKRTPTWAVIVVLSLCGTVVALQQTMVVPLLPDFPAILGVTPDDASWLVTATLLTGAVATPIMSRLADMFGKRLMMIVCMVAMTIGSVVTDPTGHYSLPLPGAGRYIVTMLEPDTLLAHPQKIILDVRSAVVNFHV